MFTSKQRSNLRSLAAKEDTIMQVGKNGISDHLVQSLSDALDKRELIKISVLENAEADAKAYSVRLAEALSAEVVAVIGRKIILYRRSEKENARHIALLSAKYRLTRNIRINRRANKSPARPFGARGILFSVRPSGKNKGQAGRFRMNRTGSVFFLFQRSEPVVVEAGDKERVRDGFKGLRTAVLHPLHGDVVNHARVSVGEISGLRFVAVGKVPLKTPVEILQIEILEVRSLQQQDEVLIGVQHFQDRTDDVVIVLVAAGNVADVFVELFGSGG